MGKMLKYFSIVALLLMLARPPQAAASADDSAGAVLAARRTAWSDRKESELISKNPIFTGELLTTNQVGRLQVLFHDDSILMMAPDTQTRITEYLYSGESQGGISLELARGVTRIISGKVTEQGGMINVSTAQAEIGIRGTDVLVRSNADGTLEVAVLQGSLGRPTTVLLPGQPPDRAVRLGHRQGVIISDRKIDWMDRGQFNNFSQSNPNEGSGVNQAGYSPPPVQRDPVLPGNPGGLDNAGNQGAPPTASEQPLSNVTATYGGSFTGMSGQGVSSSQNFVGGQFAFTIKDVNTSNPMLSSVNFYAQIDDGGGDRVYTFKATGSGNLAPVTGKNDFSVENSPNVKTEILDSGGSSSYLTDLGSSITSAEGVLHWDVTSYGSSVADFSGPIGQEALP